MNFLRNFLQGKESSKQKDVGTHSKYKDSSEDQKDDLYPLSRSATDPSNSASLIKSKGQAQLFSTSGDDVKAIETDPSLLNDQTCTKKESEDEYFQNLSIEANNYLERPSFKVEGLLSHHFNSNHSQDKEEDLLRSLCETSSSLFESNSSFTEPANEFFDCEEPPSVSLSPLQDEQTRFDGRGDFPPQCHNSSLSLPNTENVNFNQSSSGSEIYDNCSVETTETDVEPRVDKINLLPQSNSFNSETLQENLEVESKFIDPEISLIPKSTSILESTSISKQFSSCSADKLPNPTTISDSQPEIKPAQENCVKDSQSLAKGTETDPSILYSPTSELNTCLETAKKDEGNSSNPANNCGQEPSLKEEAGATFASEAALESTTKDSKGESDYLEFVFEEPNKPLKPPPQRLLAKRNQRKGKRNRPNQKDRSLVPELTKSSSPSSASLHLEATNCESAHSTSTLPDSPHSHSPTELPPSSSELPPSSSELPPSSSELPPSSSEEPPSPSEEPPSPSEEPPSPSEKLPSSSELPPSPSEIPPSPSPSFDSSHSQLPSPNSPHQHPPPVAQSSSTEDLKCRDEPSPSVSSDPLAEKPSSPHTQAPTLEQLRTVSNDTLEHSSNVDLKQLGADRISPPPLISNQNFERKDFSQKLNSYPEYLQSENAELTDSGSHTTKDRDQIYNQKNTSLISAAETQNTLDANCKELSEKLNHTRISCYGNEEFEILGNEANKLAEELGKSETYSNINMEDINTFEDNLNLESMSLEIKKSKKSSTKKDTLILQVSDSEAGPDIATGLTSSDLKCASQFFREAAELESQIRRNIASSIGSLNDFGSEGGRSSYTSECDVFDGHVKIASPNSPPHEERSAPEGTSSPDPRSLEDSEVRSRMRRSPVSSNSPEVNELLKKQALEFEEKLLRQGIVSAEKEKELHELLKEEQKQMQQVSASRDALLKLVEQYKGMLAALVGEKEKASSGQEEKIKSLQAEKQQAVEDLNNVEVAFSDVHRKYERTKQIVDTLRRNEETLRNAVADYEQKLLKQERKFTELQKHAEEKVKLANEEFECVRRANDQEMTKMGALLKKAEMKIISLQEALDRKSRENQELTQLCDDLISKVGS